MCVWVFFLSESITGVEQRPETLSMHPKPWAASMTGSSTAQTATIPPSYLSETQVNRVLFSCSLLLLWKMCACKTTNTAVLAICTCYFLLIACEPEELLVPALPETAHVERGYITSQQVYNLLNAEDGQPALFDPYYILILDCRSAERWVHGNNSCLSALKNECFLKPFTSKSVFWETNTK